MLRLGSRLAVRPRVLSRSTYSTGQEKLFDKILVANRGEIACRVMKTAKRLGIQTVAVYSDADARAMHVRMADEAVYIGPSPSADSYLQAERIITAMKKTGAQAVHPGYGFLSENSSFADRLEQEKLAFIGPGSFAIQAMGDKIESKQLAMDAKVNVIPGDDRILENIDEVLEVAEKIGYPVMIKASAGGGGKGMRIAWNKDEAIEGFRLSKQEAMASFGDDRIFVEKFIEEPRHIEIQLIADQHGNCLYLAERECSIQRRNQKVIEEAPSMAISRDVHKAMGEQAVQLAKAVKYCSAGTVEFLVDKNQNFYFLEMNTRLQVEHPVTEYVSGLDLVELMIMVAAGKKLPLTQDQVKCVGWAMESRVYAENPLANYLPSIGTLKRYAEPAGTIEDGVRVDTGVCEGSEVSMFYDAMIAKLVTHAADRNAAIEKMKLALDSYVIRGLDHNVCLLRDVLEQQRYVDGKLTTKYLDDEYPDGFQYKTLDGQNERELVAVAAVLHAKLAQRQAQIGGSVGTGETETLVVQPNEREAMAVQVGMADGRYSVGFADESSVGIDMPALPTPTTLLPVTISHATTEPSHIVVQVIEVKPRSFVLQWKGLKYELSVESELQARLMAHMPVIVAPDTSKLLLSPMPGKLVSLAVEVGASVKPGQELAVVEAMKMQNVLKSEVAGVVKSVHFETGATLMAGDVILEFEG